MKKLDDAFSGITRLGIDTPIIIYFVEAHPQYDVLATETFRRIDDGMFTGVTSVITLIEVLIHPLQRKDIRLQQEYRDLLLHSTNFETMSIDTAIAERAARLRTDYNLRIPDALQIAVALAASCEAFLTNDATLKRVTELRILVLDDLDIATR
jgi:predicted nucleic acid-binding protein